MADKRNVLVVVLAGRTDLLIVKNGEAHEVEKNELRKFHEMLENDPAAAAERFVNKHLKCSKGKVALKEAEEAGNLYADKTLSLVEKCKAEFNVRAALVLNSRRDPGKIADAELVRSEPIAVGPVLAHWMAKQFGLEAGKHSGDIGCDKAGWLNFLDGGMDLYEPNTKVVNLKGMQRIEDAIKTLLGSVDMTVVFEGGGFPQIKETVRELLRLHFGNENVEAWQVPEGGRKAEKVESSQELLPEESYKARLHAINHIRRGDYLAAYASASHALGKGKDDSWLQELEQAANFFLGEPVDMDRAPGNAALKELVAIERQHYCVAAALRTEAHMRAGRTVESLLGVSSFFDVMLLERIRKYLGLLVAPEEFPCPQDGDTDALALAKSKLGAEFAKLCKKDRRGGLRIQNHAEAVSGWVEEIGFDPLREFHKSLNPDETKDQGLKAYRNKAIHGRLDPAEAKRAKEIMEKAGLWSTTNRSPFLGQPLITCLLQELGLEALDEHYQSLENQLINILKEHRLAS